MTPSAPAEQPFFKRDTVKAGVSALAAADGLSILAGSGVSSDAGLPAWDSLLQQLLRGLPEADRIQHWDEFAEATAGVESTLGRASLVEAAYATDAMGFAETLVAALTYSDAERPQRPLVDEFNGPGQTARAIASLCVDVAPDKRPRHLITTNFDLLLELALFRAERRKTPQPPEPGDVAPLTSWTPEDDADPPGSWRVHHLHGWLPVPDSAANAIGSTTHLPSCLDPKTGNRLVLSETGYYGTNTGPEWQNAIVERTLATDSTLLIIGTSLSDPALVRHLYRTHSEDSDRTTPRAYALLLRPRPLHSLDEPHAQARIAYENLAEERWRRVGVQILFADFRFQVAQFCSEVALGRSEEFTKGKARQHFGTTARYGARLDDWFEKAFARGGLISAATEGDDQDLEAASQAFQTAQQVLTQRLREIIAGTLVPEFEALDADHLALHLWCRCPRRITYGRAADLVSTSGICALGMIGASDRSWVDPDSIDTRELHYDRDRIAVKAFTAQALRLARAPMATWDQLVAVPVSPFGTGCPAPPGWRDEPQRAQHRSVGALGPRGAARGRPRDRKVECSARARGRVTT